MGIVGIKNRTENWKTVEHFHGLTAEAKVKLVTRLLEPLVEQPTMPAKNIKIELFWQSFRDQTESIPDNQCMYVYQESFGDLRGKVEEFIEEARAARRRTFNDLEKWNYQVSENISRILKDGTQIPASEVLRTNLVSTEIDIVLETPSHLFIGEAKDESDFDAKSRYVLVHQLIRQYVMTKMLLTILGEKRNIVQFIVGRDVEDLNKKEQVRFVKQQGWLKEGNVLSWEDINRLTR